MNTSDNDGLVEERPRMKLLQMGACGLILGETELGFASKEASKLAMVVMPILGEATMATCFEDHVAYFYDNVIELCHMAPRI